MTTRKDDMEYDIDTIMSRIGQTDPSILEAALRSMASEIGRDKVASHVARAINESIVIDGPKIAAFVSERLSGIGEEELEGLASDYDMNTPEGLKEIASQLITEDVVDSFADILVDLVSIGRDSDVKVCVESIASALRDTRCTLTSAAGDYVETYSSYLLECLEEGDPLKAFIEEDR